MHRNIHGIIPINLYSLNDRHIDLNYQKKQLRNYTLRGHEQLFTLSTSQIICGFHYSKQKSIIRPIRGEYFGMAYVRV